MARASPILLAIALVAATLAAGCAGRSDPLVVAFSAPRAASGMTVFLLTDGSLLDKFRETKAEFAIYYGDRLIYPPAAKGAELQMEGRTGTAFVPYDTFVVGNGEYDVVVKYGKDEARGRVHVQKWVDYVFLRAYDKGSVVVAESALQSGTGGSIENRILAEGDLILTIVYHGLSGDQSRVVTQLTRSTRHDSTSAIVEIPKSQFDQGPGYYSIEPLFHNDEAVGNLQVGIDPTLAHESPPGNWIYITS